MDRNAEATSPIGERVRAAVARLAERLRPEGPCLRCAATGAWQGLDCPDCGGTGRR